MKLLILLLTTLEPIFAELPLNKELKRANTFAEFRNRVSYARLSCDGKLLISGFASKDRLDKDHISIEARVQILSAKGAWVSKTTLLSSLQTPHAGGENPKEPLTFTAETKGEAKYEVRLTQQRDQLHLQARLIQNSPTAPDQIRLVWRIHIPNLYESQSSEERNIGRSSEFRFYDGAGAMLRLKANAPFKPGEEKQPKNSVNAVELRTDRMGKLDKILIKSHNEKQEDLLLEASNAHALYRGLSVTQVQIPKAVGEFSGGLLIRLD